MNVLDILNETKPKSKKQKAEVVNYKANLNDVLVARLINSNINWKKIGGKDKFLKMAEIYNENFDDFESMTIALKKTTANKKQSDLKSTNVDWDRFMRIPIVAKYIEDKKLEQRRLDVVGAQKILRDQDSDKDDINRAKLTLSMNKDLVSEEVQTGQNEGLIRSHTFLDSMEEHIMREKELNQK